MRPGKLHLLNHCHSKLVKTSLRIQLHNSLFISLQNEFISHFTWNLLFCVIIRRFPKLDFLQIEIVANFSQSSLLLS